MTPVVEPTSETWKAVKEFIAERRQICQSHLEHAGLPVDETENARGAVEILHELEALAAPVSDEPLAPEVEGLD